MKATWRSLGAVVALACVGSGAHAADLRVGLGSSLGVGCNVANVRVGVGQQGFNVYGQGGLCAGGASFGGGLSVDVLSLGGGAAYAFGEFNSRGGVALGAGARFAQVASPFEGFAELGVAFVTTPLGQRLVSPRLQVGAALRLAAPELSGSAPLATAPAATSVGSDAPSGPTTCPAPDAAQDEATIRSLVASAASRTLSDTAASYGFLYRDIQYSFSISGVSVSGNTATVAGSITASAVERLSGRSIGGTFNGTVSLVRQNCAWTITGYRQS